MLNKLNQITTILSLTCALCTVTYASPINKIASSLYLVSPAENSEQYKLTISKDENTTDAHVEILPNNDGEYWIPKGYNVKVTGDYKDGYMQSTESNVLNINEAKTVNLESTVAPPSEIDLLKDRVAALEAKNITDFGANTKWYQSLHCNNGTWTSFTMNAPSSGYYLVVLQCRASARSADQQWTTVKVETDKGMTETQEINCHAGGTGVFVVPTENKQIKCYYKTEGGSRDFICTPMCFKLRNLDT